MPLVVVNTPRKSPFQVYLLALITLSGIPIAIGLSDNAITREMGEPYSTIWGFFLFIGGLLGIVGLYWPKDLFTGILIERSSLVALGGSSLIWAVLVVWRVQLNGLFSASLTFGLFLACLAQFRYLNRQVNKVMKAVKDDE